MNPPKLLPLKALKLPLHSFYKNQKGCPFGQPFFKYCEPRFVLNEKIEKIKENPRINFSDSLLYESKFYVFFVFCTFVSGLREKPWLLPDF